MLAGKGNRTGWATRNHFNTGQRRSVTNPDTLNYQGTCTTSPDRPPTCSEALNTSSSTAPYFASLNMKREGWGYG